MKEFTWENSKEEFESKNLIGLDLETTGLNRNIEYERPTSAAILETNLDFESSDIIVDDKCRLPYHVLPDAGALNVTNINPLELMGEPLSLFDLIQKMARYLERSYEKALVTYNGAAYDLIVLRHSFFAHLYDPYLLVKGTEDRLHIDLYSLAQTIYCFFPNRISFHKNQDGKVILKQELMATTNGIDPGDAHAAVDDVKTLLKLAQLMEEKVPEVFYSALASGNKKRVIELMSQNLFLNYGEVKYKERIAVKRTPTFICQDPSYTNNLVLFDLSFDPEDYLYMTPGEMAAILNKKGSPFFNIKANKSPVLLPGNLCELNGLSFEKASLRANKIQENIGFKESVVVACDINSKKRSPWESPDYSEYQIYSKFIDSHDKLLSKAFLESESTEDKINIIHQMNDGRLIDFAKRLLASENENCDPVIQMNYQEFEAKRLLSDDDVPWRTLNGARKSIENVEKRMTVNEAIMNATKTYYDIVEKELRK